MQRTQARKVKGQVTTQERQEIYVTTIIDSMNKLYISQTMQAGGIPNELALPPKTPSMYPANISSRQEQGVTRPFSIRVSPTVLYNAIAISSITKRKR